MTVMPRRVKLRSSAWLTSRSSSGTSVGQVLEQRHLHAEVVVHRGELDADRAGTDDDDVLRQRRAGEDVVRGDDPLAVRVEAGERLDPGAGGEDHVRCPGGPARRRGCRRRASIFTRTCVGPSSLPLPWIQVTLFLSTRLLRPVHRRFTICVAARGHPGVVDHRARRRRCRSPWRAGCARRTRRTRAAPSSGCSRCGGRCRRSCCWSTRATLSPSWAARNAAV